MYPYDSPSQNSIQDQLKNIASQAAQLGTPQIQQQRHVVRVKGMAGAETYNMAPNCDDILLDMDEPIIYFVMTDGAGYKTITPYDISLHKVVTQEDTLKSIEGRLSKLEEAISNGKPNSAAAYAKPKPRDGRNDESIRGNDKG